MGDVKPVMSDALKLGNKFYELAIGTNSRINPLGITNKLTGQVYADGDYGYCLSCRCEDRVDESESLLYRTHSLKTEKDETQILTLEGMLGREEPLAQELEVKHVFWIPPDKPYFEERIVIKNCGAAACDIEDIRFGFRKRLSDVQELRLVAVPYRSQPDCRVHDYSVKDLLEGNFANSDWVNPYADFDQTLVDTDKLRSEGWILTDGEQSLLVIKYNQEMIEYSMVDVIESKRKKCLSFGGAGFSLFKEPHSATRLEPGQEIAFGLTRYSFFEGDWREGYRRFKQFMNENHHGLRKDYDPPVHWNELYDIGWFHSRREMLYEHYTVENLCREAEKARELGCDLLYLDPGWEVCEGTTLWDEERLGSAGEFVERIKSDYGLETGFRTVGAVYRDEFPQEWYVQNSKEAKKHVARRIPFVHTFRGKRSDWVKFVWQPCTQCEAWKQEKLKRILAVAGAGMKFIMFDDFCWSGPCHNKSHGHPVPSTADGHVRAVYWLIEEVHKRHPEILIEAHDPVWPWEGRYLPTYFRHGLPHAYDENWGFEFMWKPLADLVSGRALCLYYYNLAYDLPLYDHMTMERDNDNCLAFWWLASTVRHLGIGGKQGFFSDKEDEKKFQAYKKAMGKYRELREFYTRGEFYGIEEYVHVHTLAHKNEAVVNAFNVSDTPLRKEVTVDLQEVGLKPTEGIAVEGVPFKRSGSRVVLDLDFQPVSPIIARIRSP